MASIESTVVRFQGCSAPSEGEYGRMCRVAIDTGTGRGGDTFRARFIGPSIVGATIDDFCNGQYEASALLVDDGPEPFQFEVFFEALNFAGHIEESKHLRTRYWARCVTDVVKCPSLRLGNTSSELTFTQYMAWHDVVHQDVLSRRLALLTLPKAETSLGQPTCAQFSTSTCTAAPHLPGRWVRRRCLDASPPCAVGHVQHLLQVGADFVWVPYACVLRVFSAPQAARCVSKLPLGVVGKSTSRNIAFELASAGHSTPRRTLTSEHVEEDLRHFGIRYLETANSPSQFANATVLFNYGVWAAFATVPKRQYQTYLRDQLARLAEVGARVVWRTATPTHSMVRRRPADGGRLPRQVQYRGEVCQTTNSLQRTALYNEAAHEVMVELGIPEVDVGSVSAFRWDRMYDCQHFSWFKCRLPCLRTPPHLPPWAI